MQGRNYIFDLHSHRVITAQKIVDIIIPNAIIKHIEEMATHDKVILLQFKNRPGVLYYNYWIVAVGYEYKNGDYSEEDHVYKNYTDSRKYDN